MLGHSSLSPQSSTVVAAEKPCAGTPAVRALEFIRRMRGGSRPWLVACDDAAYYVVKLRKNPQHVRVLANELLGALLSRLLRVPVASPAFIDVPSELAPSPPGRLDEGDSVIAPGMHFGSRFPGDPAESPVVEFLPDRLLRRVRNLTAAFCGSLVLDLWTCNCDQRQAIFHRIVADRRTSYEVFLIDNGFCFNDGAWSFPELPNRHFYPRRAVYEGVRGFDSFEPFLSKIENLNPTELEECAKAVPSDWCDGEPDGPYRLMEELYARRRGLRQALTGARKSDLRPFPNW
ncbi:MAG: HipA family kinase [Terriglobia bacterium]